MNVTETNPGSYFGISNPQPKSQLDMQTFMRLLTVQLSTQNPMEPMNDRDFFAQMAQLGTVQGLDQVQKTLYVNQAAGMIGKTVTAVRPMTETSNGQAQEVTGTVKQLNIRNGEYYLGIKEANGGIVEVKMNSILSVSE